MDKILLTNHARPAAYIVQEVGYYYCRDEGIIASGSGVVLPGTVMGKVTASGKFAPYAPGASDGTETAVAIALVGGDATEVDIPATLTVRLTEVQATRLIFADDATDPQKTSAIASLRDRGIIAR